MNKLIAFLCLVFFSFTDAKHTFGYLNALEGAWEMNMPEGSPEGLRTVMTIQSPYVFVTTFNIADKKFYHTQGGMIEVLGNVLFYTVEFNTDNEAEIGKKYEISTEIKGNQLVSSLLIDGEKEEVNYTRIDAGDSELAGSWRITDRMRNGEMQAMRLGARKTIKMITGSRFQWAAYDPTTKSFSGTGGGTIKLANGQYTEHIEFFSRNADRIGASLSFNYKVKEDKWEHSGLSSSGSPIKEIWTRQ